MSKIFFAELKEELLSSKDGRFKLFQERGGELEEVFPSLPTIRKFRHSIGKPHSISLVDNSNIHFMNFIATVKIEFLQTLWNEANSGNCQDAEHTGKTVSMFENGVIEGAEPYNLAKKIIGSILQAEAAGLRLPNVIPAAAEHSQSFVEMILQERMMETYRQMLHFMKVAKELKLIKVGEELKSLTRDAPSQTVPDKVKQLSFRERVQQQSLTYYSHMI